VLYYAKSLNSNSHNLKISLKPAAHGKCFPAGLLAGLRACCRASSCAGSAASCVIGLASHGVGFHA